MVEPPLVRENAPQGIPGGTRAGDIEASGWERHRTQGQQRQRLQKGGCPSTEVKLCDQLRTFPEALCDQLRPHPMAEGMAPPETTATMPMEPTSPRMNHMLMVRKSLW